MTVSKYGAHPEHIPPTIKKVVMSPKRQFLCVAHFLVLICCSEKVTCCPSGMICVNEGRRRELEINKKNIDISAFTNDSVSLVKNNSQQQIKD